MQAPVTEQSILAISGLYLGIVAISGGFAWAVTEGIGKALAKEHQKYKPKINLVAGMLAAGFFLMFGWLPILPVVIGGLKTTMVANGLWALFTGLISSGGAKVFNDAVWNRAKK